MDRVDSSITNSSEDEKVACVETSAISSQELEKITNVELVETNLFTSVAKDEHKEYEETLDPISDLCGEETQTVSDLISETQAKNELNSEIQTENNSTTEIQVKSDLKPSTQYEDDSIADIQDECDIKPESPADNDSITESQAKNNLIIDVQAESDLKPEAQTEADLNSDILAGNDSNTEVQVESDSISDIHPESELKPHTQPENDLKLEAQPESDFKSKAQVEDDLIFNIQLESDLKPEAQTEAVSKADAQVENNSKPQAQTQSDSISAINPEDDLTANDITSGVEVKNDSKSEVLSENDSETDIQTESTFKSEVLIENNIKQEAQAESDSALEVCPESDPKPDQTESALKPEVLAQNDSKPEAENESYLNLETQPEDDLIYEVQVKNDSNSEADTESNSLPEGQSIIDSESEIKAENNLKSEAQSKKDLMSEMQTKEVLKPEAQAKNDSGAEGESESTLNLEAPPKNDLIPEIQTEKDLKLEAQTENDPENEIDLNSNAQTESDLMLETQTEDDSKSETRVENILEAVGEGEITLNSEVQLKNDLISEIQTEEVLKPEAQAESCSEAEAEGESESNLNPEAQPKNDLTSEIQTGEVLKSEAEGESNLNSDGQTEIDLILKTQTEDDLKSEARVENVSEAESESNYTPVVQTGNDTNQETESESNLNSEAQPENDSISEIQAENDPKLEAKTENTSMPDAQSRTDSNPEAQTEDDLIPEIQPKNDLLLEIKLKRDLISDIQPEDDLNQEIQTKSDLQPDVQDINNSKSIQSEAIVKTDEVLSNEDIMCTKESGGLIEEEVNTCDIAPKADKKSEMEVNNLNLADDSNGVSSNITSEVSLSLSLVDPVNEMIKNNSHLSSELDSTQKTKQLNEDTISLQTEISTNLGEFNSTNIKSDSLEETNIDDKDLNKKSDLTNDLSNTLLKDNPEQNSENSPENEESDFLNEKLKSTSNELSHAIIQESTDIVPISQKNISNEEVNEDSVNLERNLSPIISRINDSASIVDSIDTVAMVDNQFNPNYVLSDGDESIAPTISSPNFPEPKLFQEIFVSDKPSQKADLSEYSKITSEDSNNTKENTMKVIERENTLDPVEPYSKENSKYESDIPNIVLSKSTDYSLNKSKNDQIPNVNQNVEYDEYYGLKPVSWWSSKEKKWSDKWVLTQNENGPCPLLALSNILILRGQIVVTPKDAREIKFSALIQLLADHLVSRVEQFGNNPELLQEILSILPGLRTGLDVNVGFQSIRSFGQTKNGVSDEIALFGAFGVELVHGWVPDPSEDEEAYRVLVLGPCNSTYNGAMDFLVTADSNTSNNLDNTNDISSDFTHDEQTATQLTYHGLTCLSTTLPNDYLCVLFRNNHFLTLYKRSEAELYLLVTDSGFGQSDFIVWESLQDVDQVDSQFFTSNFTLSSAATVPNNLFSSTLEESDHDLAVSLQKQEEMQLSTGIPNRKDHSRLIPQNYKSYSLSTLDSPDLMVTPHRRAVSHEPADPSSSFNTVPATTNQADSSDKKEKQCIIS